MGICFIEGQLYGRIPGKKVLTWQQRVQLEENRKKALKRKREIEATSEEKAGGKRKRTKRRSNKIKIVTGKKIRIWKRRRTKKAKVKYTHK